MESCVHTEPINICQLQRVKIMAKKPKGFQELLSQKLGEKDELHALKKLQKKTEKSSWGRKVVQTVISPEGVAKMSEVLEDFMDPYLEPGLTRAQLENAFGIGIVAWNIAIIPPERRQPMIDDVVQKHTKNFTPQDRQEFQELLNELVDRKLALFNNNLRLIADFRLEGPGPSYQLLVASSMPEGV
jgi:hypothetical protein